jgi:hypothetical protein
MPLPDRNVEWPPPAEAAAAKLYQRWGAWYAGDPEQLTAVYSNTAGIGDLGGELPKGQPTGPRFLAGLQRGVQRMFWGTSPSPGQVRGHKLHVPLASDIAMTSADLVFGEPPEFVIDDDAPAAGGDDPKAKPKPKGKGNKTQERLDEILDESNAHAVWLEGGETASGYGGTYWRVRWDPVIAECPLFDALPPDSAVPEWRGGRMVAVTLWRYLDRFDGRVWRHLERHEPGRILHAVYRSTEADKLGVRKRLQDHPETAAFALALDAGSDEQVTTGAKGLSVEYMPNMRPHRVLRGSPLGRSDYAGVEPVLDALDEAWTSWIRDLRLGKGRLVVPRSYVQSLGRGRGATFDAEREIFEAVDAITSPDGGLAISNVQFAIRVEEHSRTCRELTTQALRGAGYAAQTFGETDTVAATATEVTTREAASYRTRAKKILYARGPLSRLAMTALEIDVAKFGTKGITPSRPTLKFPDGVAVDTEALARTLQLLQAAEAASIETRVKLFNPDWQDDEIKAEVIRIKDESGKPPPVPPPGAGAGAPGQGPDGPTGPGGAPTDPGKPNGPPTGDKPGNVAAGTRPAPAGAKAAR